MTGGRTQRLTRFSLTTLALALGWTAVGLPMFTADQPAASTSACLVVDTDAGLDDYRALAMLTPARELRAVVVTEGISGVAAGTTAVSMFLASRGATPPVIPGLASPAPPAYDWLPAVRAGAERLNNFLHSAVPTAADPARLSHALGAAVHGCNRIQVLVLGPWTSFQRYGSALGRESRVVASGRSFAENNPDNFNCEYDVAACRAAPARVTFVDLPAPGPTPSYAPTEAMVAALHRTGMPGLLRTALLVDPSQWLETRLWDDAAALYLLSPRSFTPEGRHLIPAVPESRFRAQVVAAINAA
ncbi:MAG TPA: hypothetical protein VFV67_01105 [Actinophytocola sp.]|uniref:hypothetical protein n=1 Tax=Actinophytocola sp. TaxID=1872138 RepID=UPI002DBE6D37|nr:hypothetical protein [Actinophytocola sp.]HEU5469222.1 hypothetical protein [Actinophytocola sp.]